MKRTIVLIISITIILISIVLSKYYNLKNQKSEIDKINIKYEKYLNKEIKGIDIANVINLAVDNNEEHGIDKDSNGKYIQNDINSVNIEVKITEFKEEQIFTMESLYAGKMSEFVKYYGNILFKCNTVHYNSIGQVKYLLFEQINLEN